MPEQKNCLFCNAAVTDRRTYGFTRLDSNKVNKEITVSEALLLLFNKQLPEIDDTICLQCKYSLRKMYHGFNQLWNAAQNGSATFLPFGYLTKDDKECQTEELQDDQEEHGEFVAEEETETNIINMEIETAADFDCEVSDFVEIQCEPYDDDGEMELEDITTDVRIGGQEEDLQVNALAVPDSYTIFQAEDVKLDLEDQDFIKHESEEIKVEPDLTDLCAKVEQEEIEFIERNSDLTIGSTNGEIVLTGRQIPTIITAIQLQNLWCAICSEQFLQRSEFTDHMKLVHKLLLLPTTNTPVAVVLPPATKTTTISTPTLSLRPVVPKKANRRKQDLISTNATATTIEEEMLDDTNAAVTVDGQEPLSNYVPFSTTEVQETYCDICKQEYGNPNTLKDHQKIVHPFLSQSHRCPICRQYFFRGVSLTIHGKHVHNIRNIWDLMPKAQQPRPILRQKTNKSILRSSRDNKLTTNSNREPKAKHEASTPPQGLFCSSSAVVYPSVADNSVPCLEGPVLIQMPPSDTLDFISRTIFKPNPVTQSTSVPATTEQEFFEASEAEVAEAESPFPCTECPLRYKTKDGLRRHLLSEHQITLENPKPQTCKICNQLCKTPAELRRHYFRVHQQKLYQCIACPAKFGLYKEYAIHKQKVHAGKVVNCKECGKQLSNFNSLVTHRKLFCIKTSTMQTCPQCGKSFKDLKAHIKNSHSLQASVKQFICEICGATFTTQANMNVHIKTIHLVEEEFPCEICGRKFRHKRYVEIHKLIHSTEKKFECKVCKMKFAQRGTMHSHYLRHHGTEEEKGGPFECGVCGQVFRMRDDLYSHKKRELHNYGKREKSYSEKKKFRLERAQKTNLDEIKVSEQEKILMNGKTCYQCELCVKFFSAKFSSEEYLKFHKAFRHWEVLGLDKTAVEQSESSSDNEEDNNGNNASTSNQVSISAAEEEDEEIELTGIPTKHEEEDPSLNSPEPEVESPEPPSADDDQEESTSISRNKRIRKKSYKCNLCVNTSYADRGYYDYHMLTKHGIGKRKAELECRICKKYFAPGGGIGRHMKQAHRGLPATAETTKARLKRSKQFTRKKRR